MVKYLLIFGVMGLLRNRGGNMKRDYTSYRPGLEEFTFRQVNRGGPNLVEVNLYGLYSSAGMDLGVDDLSEMIKYLQWWKKELSK